MYKIEVEVEGIAPLLQHAFGVASVTAAEKPSKKVSGARDFSGEWRDTCYVTDDGELYQPAEHFEGAMIKAAVSHRITGRGRKTYKDLFKAAVFVTPDAILHGRKVPVDPPVNDRGSAVYVDVRPVVVIRARVLRSRLAFALGWKLAFDIEVLDEQIPAEVVNAVLVQAGEQVGIGDYRPRFGRFVVTKFQY